MAATLNEHSAESRLDESRRQLQHLFAPSEEPGERISRFPRSKAMRLLTGSGGATLLAIGAGGLVLMKPRLLKTVLRFLPVNAILRTIAMKFMTRGL